MKPYLIGCVPGFIAAPLQMRAVDEWFSSVGGHTGAFVYEVRRPASVWIRESDKGIFLLQGKADLEEVMCWTSTFRSRRRHRILIRTTAFATERVLASLGEAH